MMRKIFKPKNIHLSAKGAGKALGGLEARVMEYIWKHDTVTVREVCDGISQSQQKLSFNAVMTIMNRLVEKGLLRKIKGSDPYQYQPRISQERFSHIVAKDVLSFVLQDPVLFGAKGFAGLADELNPESREILRRLLKKK